VQPPFRNDPEKYFVYKKNSNLSETLLKPTTDHLSLNIQFHQYDGAKDSSLSTRSALRIDNVWKPLISAVSVNSPINQKIA
jgi:predicted transport protein